jgi:hypothetical protein
MPTPQSPPNHTAPQLRARWQLVRRGLPHSHHHQTPVACWLPAWLLLFLYLC